MADVIGILLQYCQPRCLISTESVEGNKDGKQVIDTMQFLALVMDDYPPSTDQL